MENYLVAMAVFAGIYGLMALGLNVIWGMAGMINLGLVGFMAVGAYTSALLTVRHAAWPIPLGILAAVIVTAVAGALLARVTAKMKGDYLAIVTLGFAEVMRLIAANEIRFTNGTDGISAIPGPWRGDVAPPTFNLIFLGITALAVLAAYLACERIRHSPYGRVLRAIRDDDQVTAVAGKPVLRFKTEAFAVGAAITGFAGALYGHYNAYIAPEGFVPLITIYVVLALTAGGTGSNAGAVVGAALLVAFMEGTRFVVAEIPGLAAVQVAAVREFLISSLLIVLLCIRPEGLMPERHIRHPIPEPK